MYKVFSKNSIIQLSVKIEWIPFESYHFRHKVKCLFDICILTILVVVVVVMQRAQQYFHFKFSYVHLGVS